MQQPQGLLDKLKMLPKLAELGCRLSQRSSRAARAKKSFSATTSRSTNFPILHCWPGDGGRFITLPMVFSKNPDTGKRNCGMYRMQVFDERTTGMHWQKHKQGAEHYRRLAAEGKADAHARCCRDRLPTRPRCSPPFCRCRRRSTR